MKQFIRSNRQKYIIVAIILASMATMIPSKGLSGDPLYIAASILHGETNDDCLKCREQTACALWRDMEKGVSLRVRWYGWRNARPQDLAMMERARDTRMCLSYPKCRFVGNESDVRTWRLKGWIASDTYIPGYCSPHGCSFCVMQDTEKVAAK